MSSTVKLVPSRYSAVDQRGYIVGEVRKDPDHSGKWIATLRNGKVLENSATREEAREVIEAVINHERTPGQ